MPTVAALTLAQLADLAGVTVQALHYASKSADPPPRGANGYDCRDVGQWLKRRHLRGMGVTVDGVRYDYEQERARLTKAQADKTELEAQELRGVMVRADDVVESWGRQLGAMRSRMLGLPSKAAPRARAAASDEEAAKVIEAEVLEALQELSDDGLPERTRARRTRREGHAEAAATPDGERVGGSVPSPVAGKRRRTRKVED